MFEMVHLHENWLILFIQMLLSYLLDLRNIPDVHHELLDPLRKLRKPFKWSKRLKIKAMIDFSNFGNAWIVLEAQNLHTYLLDLRNIPDGHPQLQGPPQEAQEAFQVVQKADNQGYT